MATDKNIFHKAARWYFVRDKAPATPHEIVIWWELRRIPYNIFVGVFGIAAMYVYYLFLNSTGHIQPGEDLIEPLALILAPIIINICYTAGWITELLINAVFKTTKYATHLMILGMAITVTVFFLPYLAIAFFTLFPLA